MSGSTSSAKTRLWHPFSDMGAVSQNEFVIDHGEGVWVWDEDGKRYLDGTASLWYANIGHGRKEVAEAVAKQMARLESFQIFGDFSNRPAIELAQRLTDLAPVDDARIFFGSGGGDAIDSAAKIARRYWFEQGQPHRVYLISRKHGYHGTHGYGTSIGGIDANITSWGPLHEDTSTVSHDSVDELDATIQHLGADNVAAFFCEPVIGAGGVYPPPLGYIEGVARVCAKHDVLLVVDSVICGFGRIGTWFGIERWNVRPDMITFAKGVTAGYLPLGGVVVSGRVAEPFFTTAGGPMLRHGATYAGHPTCCAAASAVLDIYEKEDLIQRGKTLEDPLTDALSDVANHPAVEEVRSGVGLLAAVALKQSVLEENPSAVAAVTYGARDAGVIIRPLLGAIAVSPPLTVRISELDLLAEGILAGLKKLA